MLLRLLLELGFRFMTGGLRATDQWTASTQQTQRGGIVTPSMSLLTGCSEPRLAFNRIVVLRYRSHLESRRLAPGTINLRLGAVRRLAYVSETARTRRCIAASRRSRTKEILW